MSKDKKDPMGQAILDYASSKINTDIIVKSEICDDDIIPSQYLFRTYEQFPEIEKIAIQNCNGKVLDIGAGAGVHAKALIEKNLNLTCIDTSPGAIKHLKDSGIDASQIDFFSLKTDEKFDTILLLMNGIGIAGTLSHLEFTLLKLKDLLADGGKIIFDSSDIKYLYEDEEGGLWVDLNTEYYGNFKFQMEYKDHTSDWFNWLYVDLENLTKTAQNAGLMTNILYNKDNHYLVELKNK